MPGRRRVRGRRPQRRAPQRGAGPAAWLAALLVPVAGLAWAYVPVGDLVTHVPPPDRPAAGALPWLHTDAGRIVDDSGRTVLLRGFNDDTLLEDGVRHGVLTEVAATLMQQSGFSVVRLPLAWSRLEPQRGRWDESYLDLVARTVDMLNRHGMWVVFDMHFLDWGPRFGGSGAPAWAALPGVPQAQWWPWESWRKHLSPAVNAALTYFYVAPDWQADFMQAWQHVAVRFRGSSGVAGYDLVNEPHPLPLPPRLFDLDWLWPLYARTIDAIGGVDPNHLFIVEGILFADYGTTMRHLAAPDLVWSPHIYTGSLVPPAFSGDRGPIDRHVTEQVQEARFLGAPLWEGELGIDHDQHLSRGWADAVLDALDDADAGWAWWQWRESGGWGIVSSTGDAVRWDDLRHLARPYVVAAPAGVRGGHGDGVRGRLQVTVAALHADRPVLVAWPLSTLHAAPTVAGTCVAASSWDAPTARLTLDLSAGAGCTVTVSSG